MKVLLVLLLLPLTAACSAGTDSLATDDGPRDVLAVELDRGDGTPAERWTLECEEPASSTHPDAEAACAALDVLDDPFAPLPDDMACTEIYGGPQKALVAGAWRGSKVDLQVHRRNGCEIGQWDSLVPLLPAPS